MNSMIRIAFVGCLCLGVGGWPLPAAGEADYVPGEVLVLTAPRTSHSLAAPPQLAEMAGVRSHEYEYLSSRGTRRFFFLQSDRLSTPELLKRLESDPTVVAASPNYRRRLCRIPGDPKWPKLWGLGKINAPAAWDTSVGSAGVVAAVIDTGIDLGHPDLAGNLWQNPGEIPGNGRDDDGNGLVDDVVGYDFAADNQGNNDSDPSDIEGHGSHVAGIIAAVGDNGTGVCGVTWNTRIMALKGFRPDGYLYDSDEIEALQYVTRMKVDHHIPIAVVNASYGSSGFSSVLNETYKAVGDAGIVVTAAAGNGGDDDTGDDNDMIPFYPASYSLETIVSVAATDPDDNLGSFSNFGATSVDIAAPGVAIYSTVLRGSGADASVRSGDELLDAAPLTYSGITPTTGILRPIISCGLGLTAADFPATVRGNIALIERGQSNFRDKALLATNAGAIAAIVFNNAPGNFSGTLLTEGNWIPVVSISQEDGVLLRGRSGSQVLLRNIRGDYDTLQGTSMASPHLAGAVALLAAVYPDESAVQRIARLMQSAETTASLQGKVASNGRLNLEGALSFSLGLTLSAHREEARSWTQRQDYAHVSVEIASSRASAPQTVQIQVLRRQGSGAMEVVAEYSLASTAGSTHAIVDRYLTPGVGYTYRAVARDSTGRVLGVTGDTSI